MTLSSIAVEAFIDGVVGERYAVERLKIGGRRALPEIASKIQSLADDEQEHVDLAEAVVNWCIAHGGRRVRVALVAAAHELPIEAEHLELDLTLPEIHRSGLVNEKEAQTAWSHSRQQAQSFISASVSVDARRRRRRLPI